MSVDRKAVRRRIEDVQTVLLTDWDPLSVGGNPLLSDEYDFCLGKIIKALDTGNGERIIDQLVETENALGVGPTDRAALATVAHRLLELPFP